jgi:hypothetical protein
VKRTRALSLAALAVTALAAPASAQIIATSIPKEFSPTTGKTVGEKKWAFHVMGAPLAKWKYGEVYIGQIDDTVSDSLGNVQATPNSDLLFAGEVAFRAGKNWSVGVGGWYNKVGKTVYGFNGDELTHQNEIVGLIADLDGDLSLYEGHVGLFYKDIGLQAGIIKTTGKIGTTIKVKSNTYVERANRPVVTCTSDCEFDAFTEVADTTDWDAFAVYKHSWGGRYPLGLSLGAGVYGKQGETESPLRDSTNKVVFSGFATANIGVYKGLGIDTSFWYIDKTDAIGSGPTKLGTRGNDSQYRFTVGVGYTFSK